MKKNNRLCKKAKKIRKNVKRDNKIAISDAGKFAIKCYYAGIILMVMKVLTILLLKIMLSSELFSSGMQMLKMLS